MKILRIVTQGFRGLADAEYAFGPGDAASALTLVEGPIGSGKTSLLEAVAAAKELVGAYGAPPAGGRLLRRGTPRGRLEATWQLTQAEMELAQTDRALWSTAFTVRPGAPYELADPGLRRLFATHPVTAPQGCGGLELFDASRELSAGARRTADEEAELAARAAPGRDRYAGLVPWLVRRVLREGVAALDAIDRDGLVARWDREDVLGDVRRRVRHLLPDLHLEGVELGSSSAVVRFARRDGAQLELTDLSDGERAKVLLALAFRRFSLDHGIALIDDVDRGLPPDRRGELLAALPSLARDVQLVVTTRSTRPAAELPKHHRIVLGGVP